MKSESINDREIINNPEKILIKYQGLTMNLQDLLNELNEADLLPKSEEKEKKDKESNFRERINLRIILQSYKYFLQNDEIIEKINLSDLQREILFEAIDETLGETISKIA